MSIVVGIFQGLPKRVVLVVLCEVVPSGHDHTVRGYRRCTGTKTSRHYLRRIGGVLRGVSATTEDAVVVDAIERASRPAARTSHELSREEIDGSACSVRGAARIFSPVPVMKR